MQWSDRGVIIGTRKHGETSLIVELMTAEHGRHLGLVRGGRSRRMQPLLQPGNHVQAVWRARLDSHLGTYAIEPLELAAARLMSSRCALAGLQLLGSHLRLLAERDPHRALYEAARVMLEHLTEPEIAGPLMVKFEVRLLDELGFGLDLSRCAGSGVTQDLVYVSPRSGQAVSRDAGAPWADKLLALPRFLIADTDRKCAPAELSEAFALTGFFLHRDVWTVRDQDAPASRAEFIRAVQRASVPAD